MAHLSAPPPHPSAARPYVPAQFDEVIATGMAKDPDQRYATTVELASAAHDAITAPIGRPGAAQTAEPAATAGDVVDRRGRAGRADDVGDADAGHGAAGPRRSARLASGPRPACRPPPAAWVDGAARPRSRAGWIIGGVVAVVVLAAALVTVVVVAGQRTPRPTQAAPASTQAAPAPTQAAPSSTQPSASAEVPAMNGNYTARTWAAEGVANVTEMGWTITTGCTDHNGCTARVQTTGLSRQCIGAVPCEDLKPTAPMSGDAKLYGSSWTLDWDIPNGVQCNDGSLKGPLHNHYIWDATTLKGTKTSSWAAGLCLSTEPASSYTFPFSLIKA